MWSYPLCFGFAPLVLLHLFTEKKIFTRTRGKMGVLTSMSMHSILIILLLLHQTVADPVDDTDEHLKSYSDMLMRARMKVSVEGKSTGIKNIVNKLLKANIPLKEYLVEPTDDMSINRLEVGYEAAKFVLDVPTSSFNLNYELLVDQYKKKLKEKIFESLTGTPGTCCKSERTYYKESFPNYILIAGERERVADKLVELERSNELVVSSILRASLLLDVLYWEHDLHFFELSKIEYPDIERKVYALNYHELSAQKLAIIIDQVSRFLKKRGTRAPPGGWEEREIQRLRESLKGMKYVRSRHRNNVPTYIDLFNEWVTSIPWHVEYLERYTANREYRRDATSSLKYLLRGGILKLAATVFMQLPYPEKLSPEYLDLAASVVRAYQNYLKLLSWARYNARELVQRGIKVEGLNLAEIEIRTRGEHGRRVLALYERGKNAGVEGQKYHILFWRLELVILAVSPFVEMPRFSKYGCLIDDRGIRERLLRLQHRRNEYLPYVWKELTDGNIEIYHQKIQSKIQELKNALEPMAIEDLQSILNVDSEDALLGMAGLSPEIITIFQLMPPPDNAQPEYLELAAVFHCYYSQLLEWARKLDPDQFGQRWEDQIALWTEYYSATVRARDRDLQEDLEAYFENWGLPEDTAGDDGNNQASVEAAPVDPLEHSVGAHRVSHYAALPESSRGVDTRLGSGRTNHEVVSRSTKWAP
ncbi:hypothetical protein SeMB42_g02841 [Synchytrium endobioticum]|uniref:Uncharacterized protein n=1 Tax=Synchytrium endobioticum TaxID=286115 RepID=A0A507DAW4_9FUNG|nr:hypothetical protein SeMB42_g02841 [Synchytrium endobioticum]